MDIEKLESILLKKSFSELSPAEREMVTAEVGTESDYEHLRETLLRVKTTFVAESALTPPSDDFKAALMHRFETSRPSKKGGFDLILQHIAENLKPYSFAGSMAFLVLIYLVYNNITRETLTPEIAKFETKNTISSIPSEESKPDENETTTQNIAGKAKEQSQIKSIQPENKKVQFENIQPNEPHSYEVGTKINDMEDNFGAPADVLTPVAQDAKANEDLRDKNLEETRTRQNQTLTTNKTNKDNTAKKQNASVEKQKNEGKIAASRPEMAASSGTTSTVSAAEAIETRQRYPVFLSCSQLTDAEYDEKCFYENLYQYLNKNFKADGDESQNLSGKIKVLMSMNIKGEVVDIKVLNQVNQKLEQRIIDGLKSLPNFKKPTAETRNHAYEVTIDLGRLR